MKFEVWRNTVSQSSYFKSWLDPVKLGGIEGGRPSRVGWCAGFESFVCKDAGSNPGVPNRSVWDGSQWRDSVSLARVYPALNGYLEKSGEGKQEGCAKAQDGWPPTTPLHFLAEGVRNGDQHLR